MNLKQIRRNFDIKTLILCTATIILLFLYTLPWLVENLYYDSAEDIKDNTNSDVKFIGHVIWIDPESAIEEYPDSRFIIIEKLVEPQIMILTDNNNIKVGDDVIVEGYYYSESYEEVIIGYQSSQLGSTVEPIPAEVQEVWWHHGFYFILKLITWFALIYGLYLLITSEEERQSDLPAEELDNHQMAMIFCTQCGMQIDADSKFCIKCGNKVTE